MPTPSTPPTSSMVPQRIQPGADADAEIAVDDCRRGSFCRRPSPPLLLMLLLLTLLLLLPLEQAARTNPSRCRLGKPMP